MLLPLSPYSMQIINLFAVELYYFDIIKERFICTRSIDYIHSLIHVFPRTSICSIRLSVYARIIIIEKLNIFDYIPQQWVRDYYCTLCNKQNNILNLFWGVIIGLQSQKCSSNFVASDKHFVLCNILYVTGFCFEIINI